MEYRAPSKGAAVSICSVGFGEPRVGDGITVRAHFFHPYPTQNRQTMFPATAQPSHHAIQYAGFWPLLFARIIDGFGFTLLATAVYYPLLASGVEGYTSSHLWSDIYGLAFLLRWLIYYPVMESLGGTFGKRIMGLHTVAVDGGGRPGWTKGFRKMSYLVWPWFLGCALLFLAASVAEEIGQYKLFDAVFGACAVFGLFVFTWAPLDRNQYGQGYHDRFADTTVIRA